MSTPGIEPNDTRSYRPRAGLNPRHPLDESLLDRHRAKVLRAESSVPVVNLWPERDNEPPVDVPPTVYRYEWLLIPRPLLSEDIDDTEFRNFLDGALQRIDLHIDVELARETADAGSDRLLCRLLPLPDRVQRVPIDAWYALQTLRLAAVEEDRRRSPNEQRVSRATEVQDISLNHLFFSASTGGQFTIAGTAGKEGHGDDWGPGRLPAFVPLAKLASPSASGPVVAVLDTGCWHSHPWLRDAVTVEPAYLPNSWVDPETRSDLVDPLLGVTDSHSGHGTFTCGVIRQIEPEARIVVYPLMHSDGIVEQADLDHQLDQIAAQPGIDVVVMPFGGYASEETGINALKSKLDRLRDAGIVLVASAGNDASAAKMYPAAFDSVVGVGALTRRHTVAIYSNEDPETELAWYPGSSIVSTLPPFLGSHTPQYARPPLKPDSKPREGFDPDNHAYVFGIWHGTSFSAAIAAARAAGLVAKQPRGSTPSLSVEDARDLVKHVRDALIEEGKHESWPEEHPGYGP